MADSDLFEKGLKKRRQVLGEKYVDANLAGSDDIMMTFQRAVTELAWGYAWSRSGLDQKTRSLLTLGILGGARPLSRAWYLHKGRACQRSNSR